MNLREASKQRQARSKLTRNFRGFFVDLRDGKIRPHFTFFRISGSHVLKTAVIFVDREPWHHQDDSFCGGRAVASPVFRFVYATGFGFGGGRAVPGETRGDIDLGGLGLVSRGFRLERG